MTDIYVCRIARACGQQERTRRGGREWAYGCIRGQGEIIAEAQEALRETENKDNSQEGVDIVFERFHKIAEHSQYTVAQIADDVSESIRKTGESIEDALNKIEAGLRDATRKGYT